MAQVTETTQPSSFDSVEDLLKAKLVGEIERCC